MLRSPRRRSNSSMSRPARCRACRGRYGAASPSGLDFGEPVVMSGDQEAEFAAAAKPLVFGPLRSAPVPAAIPIGMRRCSLIRLVGDRAFPESKGALHGAALLVP